MPNFPVFCSFTHSNPERQIQERIKRNTFYIINSKARIFHPKNLNKIIHQKNNNYSFSKS